MKTKLFFFAMLASMAASAQSTVQITPISATYTNSPTVQFKVNWTNQTTDNHRNKVWIFLDFQTVISPTQKGNWQPATITGTVQKTAGTVSGQSNRGFFLEGTTTNFSSTVTVQLSNTGISFNWCAYASDYPPNVTLDKGTYTFKGTTDFIVSNPTQTLTTTTIVKNNLTANSATTFTDATGCPGIGSLYCPYTGSDLYMDATHLCQQRTSGAKNWEAWIKDSRDNKYYRIVLMPDNKWWLAQNMKLASYNSATIGSATSGCTEDECGRSYSHAQVYAAYGGTSGSSGNVQGICPPGWLLPVKADFDQWSVSIGSTATICEYLRGENSSCSPRPNYYGFSNKITNSAGAIVARGDAWYTNDAWREDGLFIDIHSGGTTFSCGSIYTGGSKYTTHLASVRCFRIL